MINKLVSVFLRYSKVFCLFLFSLTVFQAPAFAQSACPSSIKDCKTTQEMLTLAIIAGVSAGLEGNIGPVTSTTTKRMACLLPIASALGNNWKRVWGPALILKQKSGSGICGALFPPPKQPTPANTMFVAKKNNENTYAIAVAGTDPSSGYDWCVEDANITPVAWPFGLHGGFVNQGTDIGVGHLRDLQQATAPQTLVKFLAQIASIPQPATVYVTGHSLGGALAPTLALWLKNHRRTWDPFGRVTLKVYAFAGATPGDKVFAAYINSQFTGDALNVINNTLDVVPHAWNITTLKQTTNLFSAANVNPGFLVTGVIAAAETNNLTTIQNFKKSHPRYPFGYGRTGTQSQRQPITGKLISPPNWPYANCPTLNTIAAVAKAKSLGKDDTNYLLETAYQHLCAYPNQLSLTNLRTKENNCINAHPLAGETK